MAYKNPQKRRDYVNKWRANRVAQAFYGLCKSCDKPLGRNEGIKGANAKGHCINCNKGSVHQSWKGGYINSDGYIVISKGKLQHRIVMEEYLGRTLYKDENVNHINGDRKDNRIDNLELWSSSQPSGQRIADKVNWAREILERYA